MQLSANAEAIPAAFARISHAIILRLSFHLRVGGAKAGMVIVATGSTIYHLAVARYY